MNARDPATVYVRNGGLICLGDMMRLLTVGPTETDSLSMHLDDPSVRLDPSVGSVSLNAFPQVPAGCLVGEFFNLVPYDPSSGAVAGMVNINTASASVLKCLPGLADLAATNPADANAFVDEIIAYRDRTKVGTTSGDYTNPNTCATLAGIGGLRDQPGFAAAGEVAIPLRVALDAMSPKPSMTFATPQNPPNYYHVGNPGDTDDGLPTDANGVTGDAVKRNIFYAWLSNQVTVRSNTYIVYIRVQRDNNPKSQQYRSYVAVIDRSRCPASPPEVLMFAEVR